MAALTAFELALRAQRESRDGEWPPPPPEEVPDDAPEIEASGLFEDIQARLRLADGNARLVCGPFGQLIATNAGKRVEAVASTRLGTRSSQGTTMIFLPGEEACAAHAWSASLSG